MHISLSFSNFEITIMNCVMITFLNNEFSILLLRQLYFALQIIFDFQKFFFLSNAKMNYTYFIKYKVSHDTIFIQIVWNKKKAWKYSTFCYLCLHIIF